LVLIIDQVTLAVDLEQQKNITMIVAMKGCSIKLDMTDNFYLQKMVRCQYNYNTPTNRHCKYQDFESEMIETKFGQVCLPCFHVICLGEKAKEELVKQVINY